MYAGCGSFVRGAAPPRQINFDFRQPAPASGFATRSSSRRRPATLPLHALPDESREVLDAFYLGRAVAQTVSERLGAVLGDVLSEVVKISAEQQRAIKDFQDEVKARAEADRADVLPALSFPSTAVRSSDPRFANARNVNVRPYTEQPAPDLQETVDDLRAEVAAARASVRQLRAEQLSRSSF